MCHAIDRYAKANNKYMKSYDKNIMSSCLMYLDTNNLYGWAMSQKIPVGGKKCSELVSSIHDKQIYVFRIYTFKQALSHGLILKKVDRVVQFNQKAWLKPLTWMPN